MKPRPVPPLYPVLLAPVPMLFLLAMNIQQVYSLLALRLFLASLAAGGILLGLTGLILRRAWARAGLVSALVILLANLCGGLVWWSAVPVLALAGLLAVKAHPTPAFTRYANLVCLTLQVCLLVIIGWQAGPRDWFDTRRPSSVHASDQPDIYFIVLDSHTSQAVLARRFGYDNHAFLDDLAGLGFQVGACLSAFPSTDTSLASTLNPHATELPEGMRLWGLIRDSEVRKALEQRGYQTVAFASGFVWTEIMDADLYYQPPVLTGGLNTFEIFYLKQTIFDRPLSTLYDLGARLSQIYRDRTETVLGNLAAAAVMDGPQFVFAHLLQPHPPFIFNAEGDPIDWSLFTLPGQDPNPTMRVGYSIEGYNPGYVMEVRYIEAAILPPLTAIIETAPDSIIILAGDHGPWFAQSDQEERAILCAVRGPGLPVEPRAAFVEILK